MKVLPTLALVLLVPVTTLSSASQIEPQTKLNASLLANAKLADMRLSGIVDYHHALFSMAGDDLGLEAPMKDTLDKIMSRLEWPQPAQASEDAALPENSYTGSSKLDDRENMLVMTLSALGLLGFMSARRRRK